jgi:hypothetical protein
MNFVRLNNILILVYIFSQFKILQKMGTNEFAHLLDYCNLIQGSLTCVFLLLVDVYCE